jgi:hypothetical protein
MIPGFVAAAKAGRPLADKPNAAAKVSTVVNRRMVFPQE